MNKWKKNQILVYWSFITIKNTGKIVNKDTTLDILESQL